MTGRLGFLLVACLAAAIGCNAIVGVENVTKKSVENTGDPDTSKKSTKGSTGSGETSSPAGDDDDTTNTLTPDAGSLFAGKPECNAQPDCERVVFVTSAVFTGNLGGLAGADQKCFEAAKSIPGSSGRSFHAWLSSSLIDAKIRIPNGTKPFRRTDGKVVATNFADLVDGTLDLAFNLDENGHPLTGTGFDHSVWTSSDETGTWIMDSACVDWTDEQVTNVGGFGDSDALDSQWSIETGEPYAESSCNAQKHIYCIEY